MDGALEATIAGLQDLNIDGVRAAWREHLDGPPPKLRSADLLRRCLAEELQLRAFGGDAETEKALAKLARAHGRGERPKAPKATFKPGTVLVREHAGQSHRVEILEDGFRWNGEVHASLSVIARAITGVRWNGPRFFGLREEKVSPPTRRAAGGRR